MTVLASLPGTDLALFLRSYVPVRKIIDQGCELSRALDDMGKDLSQNTSPNDLHPRPLARMSTQSTDQQHTIVDWHIPDIPSPGSRGITVEGTLALRVGGTVETIIIDLAAQNGARATWQDTTWQVIDLTESDWEDGFKEMTISRTGPRPIIQSVQVVNNDGDVVEDAVTITDSSQPHEPPTIAYSGYLKTVRLQMTVIQKNSVIKLPIRIDTGLGVQEVPGRSAGNQL